MGTAVGVAALLLLQGAPLGPDAVARAAGVARGLVAEHTGADLDDVAVRVARRPELEAALLDELRRHLDGQVDDPADLARRRARDLARTTVAKLVLASGEVLVLPDNLGPELAAEPVLAVVLAHELLHAVQDRERDLDRWLAAADDLEGFAARCAVVEGHAQLVLRELAYATGRADAFERFTGALGVAGRGDDGLALGLHDGALYHDGERFVARLLATGSIDRVFREPPARLAQVLHPASYLDPELRDRSPRDLEAGLDALAAELARGEWRRDGARVARSGLERALEEKREETREETREEADSRDGLLDDLLDDLLDGVLDARVRVLTDRVDPTRRVVATLVELASAERARALVRVQRRALEARARRAGATTRELSAGDLDTPDGPAGAVAVETTRARGERALSLTARRGALVVEVVGSSAGVAFDVDLLGRLAAAALGRTGPEVLSR